MKFAAKSEAANHSKQTNRAFDVYDISQSDHNLDNDSQPGGSAENSTIMQQINSFSLMPMNDSLAEMTIQDHKYLLEQVENKCAIAFFAMTNRNQSLYNALQRFTCEGNENFNAARISKIRSKDIESGEQQDIDPLESLFIFMMQTFDFMSVVMYPALKNRREFVHHCWKIAKAKENEELKRAVCRDQYFFLSRTDILCLLRTSDDNMITFILEMECKLLIDTDIAYKQISIKNQQLDFNQHSTVELLDFVSVLITNKRVDDDQFDSPIQFNHNYVLRFLERHSKYVKADQVLKILILEGKFRLSLQFLHKSQTPFQIEFFTNAIEADAYDIAFYLLGVYEEEILSYASLIIETHVRSYQLSKQFLKAKLYLSSRLISLFNFKSAKELLDILKPEVEDTYLEKNLFSYSCNPLLSMCLLYELLLKIMQKFFSLNNMCRSIMATIIKMAINYIECVDDEHFLTKIMLERDYTGRDSLRVAQELELLELIQHPKVEALVKRIFNSDYEQNGSLLSNCTAYQIIFSEKVIVRDPEEHLRFYKKRDLKNAVQSQWMYQIFKQSMNSRVQAVGIIGIIFTVISAVYYEATIEEFEISIKFMDKIEEIRETLFVSDDPEAIKAMIAKSDQLFEQMLPNIRRLESDYWVLKLICILNMAFFLQHVTTFIFTRRVNRFYRFPTLLHLTDLILFIMSIEVLQWLVEGMGS